MKKLVGHTASALVAIALVGSGSIAALAGTASASTTSQVCAQLASQANNILTPLANASSAYTAASSAFTTAQATLTTDLTGFVTAIVPVIHDLDAGIDNPAHNNAFATAETTFVNDYVTTANDRIAAFNTGTTLAQLQLQQSTISQLQNALCK
ncbi:MAG: hypothetical protein M3N98_01725 [Actinomycetota bacterium]|nr:hypothetical protein [Actinomycetota bacterium]